MKKSLFVLLVLFPVAVFSAPLKFAGESAFVELYARDGSCDYLASGVSDSVKAKPGSQQSTGGGWMYYIKSDCNGVQAEYYANYPLPLNVDRVDKKLLRASQRDQGIQAFDYVSGNTVQVGFNLNWAGIGALFETQQRVRRKQDFKLMVWGSERPAIVTGTVVINGKTISVQNMSQYGYLGRFRELIITK